MRAAAAGEWTDLLLIQKNALLRACGVLRLFFAEAAISGGSTRSA